jgi:DNA ligase-1
MIEFDKTIYKKDSKGKLRFLRAFSNKGELVQFSGVVGSENTVEHRSNCKPKNVGKSNETSAEEQAVYEAERKLTNKMSEGYFEKIEDAESTQVILPMLAKDYKKESHKIVYPCYVQPKLDGMRALYNQGYISSRKGKDIETMMHIVDDVANSTHAILDGELYAHGKTFQENMRLIKKFRPGSEDVVYHVYDIIMDAPFEKRYEALREIIGEDVYNTVQRVETYIVPNEEAMLRFHAHFIEQGYEGTIVRHSDAGYAINKRDSQLLKYKDFIDEAYQVVKILPSDKNPSHAVIHCALPDGRTFGCGMKFSHEEREEILANPEKYLGLTAEVRFFEYSDDGIPRFPVCHGFRLDK